MDSRGEVLDIYDDTEIFGNATYEILDTEYGKAMKVTGKGNILILTKHPDGAKRSNSAANLYLKSFGLSMSDFKPLEEMLQKHRLSKLCQKLAPGSIRIVKSNSLG